MKTAYLAPQGFEQQLLSELRDVEAIYGRLVVTKAPLQKSFWAQNTWLNPEILAIASISSAVKQLKERQRRWWPYSFHFHRRTEIIHQQLPRVRHEEMPFPSPSAQKPLGSFTLLDANTLLAATQCSSAFPNGEMLFRENKKEPPNRAYLKLWEVFSRFQKLPKKGEFCLDLGGSPGGWAWVLQQLGSRVLSVDRSPLHARIMKGGGVEFRRGDAFALEPKEFPQIDWFFSDVICFPEKLYSWVLGWLEAGVVKNFVCTIKLKGHDHLKIIQKFAQIPGSEVLHLFHNKNELTWVNLCLSEANEAIKKA